MAANYADANMTTDSNPAPESNASGKHGADVSAGTGVDQYNNEICLKKAVGLGEIITFFFLSSFAPRKNAAPNYKRYNKSNHEYGNPHNYSLSFTVFFEVHKIPITAHPMETTKPTTISIYCGNSPRNIPPRIKLAKVNFATSSINFPTFSFVLDSVLFTLNNLLKYNITQYYQEVKRPSKNSK